MKRKTPITPNEYLDQHTQRLAKKHQRRLQTMTFEAIDSLPKKRRSIWFKPVLASAFTVAIIATTLLLQNTEKPIVATALPAWVMDTETPVTLIENLDFYDWLAQQTEQQYSTDEKHITVAINQSYWFRFGQRLPSHKPAQRLLRTTSYLRSIQK
jgi:hypothetical protein